MLKRIAQRRIRNRCRNLRSLSLMEMRERMSWQRQEHCWTKDSWRKREQRQPNKREMYAASTEIGLTHLLLTTTVFSSSLSTSLLPLVLSSSPAFFSLSFLPSYSHPINWRDDPPQEVHASSQDFLRTANVILCHFLISFATSFKSPLTKLSFLPTFFLKNPPNCHASSRCRHGASSGTANRIRTSLNVLQNFLEWGFLLPLTLLSFLFFPSSVRKNFSCSCPSRVKYSHT